MANIHINPDVVTETVAQYFPSTQVECLGEYNAQVRASNGAGISASKLWNVCAAGGLDITTASGKQTCQSFVNALVKSINIEYKEVCGNDRDKTGGTERCVPDFSAVSVNIGPAIAIAKEYAHIKYNDDSLECSSKHRYALNNNDDYVKCVSKNSNTFYEFQFDSVTASIDNKIKNGIMLAVCTIYEAPVTLAGYSGGGTNVSSTLAYQKPSCSANAEKCNQINTSISKFGYSAQYENDKCKINFETVSDASALRTAFGIDNFVFCGDIQALNNQSTESYVKEYIAQRAGVSADVVTCETGFKTYTGTGCRVNGLTDFKDDIKTCYVGNTAIDLVFNDINESWNKYTNSADQAMSCIITGGTFTGKACTGLNEQQCEIVRNTNAQSCPECKQIRWNAQTGICELPESVDATWIRRGLKYTAIVGGVIVSGIITVGTMGTGTAATAIVFVAEVPGGVLEFASQLVIDTTADTFITSSANCNDEFCAQDLITRYLTKLSRQQNDLTDTEAHAVDQEMARLMELIPTNSDWWGETLRNEDGTSLLAAADDGKWTTAQVWRAVGIGMQFAGVLESVGLWLVKNTQKIVTNLPQTSKILLRNAEIAQKNFVNVDKLDDIGKEWYKLWQEYAPKNQTFDQFKAMANGNLDEMKQMTKTWVSRSDLVAAQKELENKNQVFEDLMDKYNIDAFPQDSKEISELAKQHPDLITASNDFISAHNKFTNMNMSRENYSTFNPEFSKFLNERVPELRSIEQQIYDTNNEMSNLLVNKSLTSTEFNAKSKELNDKLNSLYSQRNNLLKQNISQWDVAENFSLENIANVASERAQQFKEIVKSDPSLEKSLNPEIWSDMTDEERLQVAQKIIDDYATKTGTPSVSVKLEPHTNVGGFYNAGTKTIFLNPNANMKTPDGFIEILSHEHAHSIDDLAAKEGALGNQYQYYTNTIYNNSPNDGYYVALKEQSSYKIGSTVSKEVTNSTNPLFEKNYNLELAKREAQNAEKKINNAAIISSSIPAGIGLWTGGIKTIFGSDTPNVPLKQSTHTQTAE